MTTVINPRRLGTGLLAVTAIAAILVGVPVGLWALGGNPLPTSLPSVAQVVAALTRPDNGTLFLGLLKIVGWVGWLSYALPLVLEILRTVGDVRVPQLPMLRLQHRQSAALVAAAGALMSLTGQAAHAAPMPVTHAGGHTAATASLAKLPKSEAAQAHQTQTRQSNERFEVVDFVERDGQPPVMHVRVHRGDTLSEIAQEELDDASRWPEIAKASAGITQPDGHRLTDPDLIYPGWTLNVPTDTEGPAPSAPAPSHSSSTAGERGHDHQAPSPTPTASSSAPSNATTPSPATPTAPASAAPSTATPSAPSEQAPTTAPTDSPTATPSAPSSQPTTHPAPAVIPPAVPSAPSGASTTRGGEAPAQGQDDEIDASTQAMAEDISEHIAPVLFTVAGLGSLGAAGLVAALARRRRRQSRHRRPGQRIPLPTGEAAVTESQLRVAADPLTADHLDRALRTLAAHARHRGEPVPALNAARVTVDALELYLADVKAKLPDPFTPIPDDPGAWTFDRTHLDQLLTADEAADVAAPYPALVTLGADEDNGHLMLNLEQIGSLGLTGDAALCHEVLTALAVELVTSTWCDDSRITLIGVLPELVEAVGSDRATYIPDIEAALPALDYLANVHREALEREGLSSTTEARDADLLDATWTPHIILVSAHLLEEDRERLTALVATMPRVAIAAITAGAEPVGTWGLSVRLAGDRIVGDLTPGNVRITPQHLSIADYARILDVFAIADQPAVPGPAWADGIADGISLDDLPDDTSALSQTEDLQDGDETAPERTGSHAAALAGPHATAEDPADVDEDAAPEQNSSATTTIDVVDDETELEAAEDVAVPVEVEAPDVEDAPAATDLDDGESQDAPTTAAERDEVDEAPTASAELDDVPAQPEPQIQEQPATPLEADPAPHDAAQPSIARTGSHALAPATPSTNTEPAAEEPAVESSESRMHLLAPTVTTATAAHLDVEDLPDERMLVRLLGSVDVRSATGRNSRLPARTREIVTYLALMPGQSEIAFSEAMWRAEDPTGPKASAKRNQYLARARSWVGTTPEGRPYIAYVDDLGYSMDPSTPIDWWRFRDLTNDGIANTSDHDLAAALKLVTGRPLSGIDTTRFTWIDSITTTLIDAVADVAHELATRCLETGDTRTAIWAIEKGLLADETHEALWRLRIIAATQAHASVRDVVARMHATLDDDLGELDPETLNLIHAAYDRVPA